MGRVVVISQRHDRLTRLIMENSYDAVATTSFNFTIKQGDILCWLPLPNEPVDDEVQDLAALIDNSIFLPAKIVMLSIAGSADDAEEDQLKRWYGKQAVQDVLTHQYAIKMIDEFEIPYTIIRALPLTAEETSIQLLDEGQPMHGTAIGEQQAAATILRVLSSDKFNNHSIGIAPATK